MKMYGAIAAAFGWFLALFAAQIALSRSYKPKSEDRFIVSLFLLLPMVAFGLGWAVGLVEPRKDLPAFLLFFVVSSSWVASYPVIYGVCPTLIISLVVRRNGSGTTLEELRDLLGLHRNSVERIEDAVHDRLVRKEGDLLELTALGRVVLLFYRAYRTALGLKLDPL